MVETMAQSAPLLWQSAAVEASCHYAGPLGVEGAAAAAAAERAAPAGGSSSAGITLPHPVLLHVASTSHQSKAPQQMSSVPSHEGVFVYCSTARQSGPGCALTFEY